MDHHFECFDHGALDLHAVLLSINDADKVQHDLVDIVKYNVNDRVHTESVPLNRGCVECLDLSNKHQIIPRIGCYFGLLFDELIAVHSVIEHEQIDNQRFLDWSPMFGHIHSFNLYRARIVSDAMQNVL